MENTKKTYTANEVAVKVLDRIRELYSQTDLYKSNTAHEIEAGSEPKTQNTECPESLEEGDNIKKAKKKHNDSGNEVIEGGKADGMGDDDFDEEDTEVGAEVEKEHTDDPEAAKEIAQDHLSEDEDYYEEGAESAKENLAEEIDSAEEKVGEEKDEDEDEDEEEEEDEEPKKKEKKFEKSEETQKACGLKSPKLGEFVRQRAMKKAKVYDIKSKKKVADLPGDDYEPEKIKKPSEKFLRDQKKYKEQIEAGRNPAKDMKDRHARKKAKKKAVYVDKERANKDLRRKVTKKTEKMLGIANEAKEAYKKPEIKQPPKLNEGY